MHFSNNFLLLEPNLTNFLQNHDIILNEQQQTHRHQHQHTSSDGSLITFNTTPLDTSTSSSSSCFDISIINNEPNNNISSHATVSSTSNSNRQFIKPNENNFHLKNLVYQNFDLNLLSNNNNNMLIDQPNQLLHNNNHICDQSSKTITHYNNYKNQTEVNINNIHHKMININDTQSINNICTLKNIDLNYNNNFLDHELKTAKQNTTNTTNITNNLPAISNISIWNDKDAKFKQYENNSEIIINNYEQIHKTCNNPLLQQHQQITIKQQPIENLFENNKSYKVDLNNNKVNKKPHNDHGMNLKL